MKVSRLACYLLLAAWWGALGQAWWTSVLGAHPLWPYLVAPLLLMGGVTILAWRMARRDRQAGVVR